MFEILKSIQNKNEEKREYKSRLLLKKVRFMQENEKMTILNMLRKKFKGITIVVSEPEYIKD